MANRTNKVALVGSLTLFFVGVIAAFLFLRAMAISHCLDQKLAACDEIIKSAFSTTQQRGDAYFNLGMYYLNNKNLKQAIAEFNEYIALFPSEAAGYYERATAHQLNTDFKNAVEDYDRAIHFNPDYADAFVQRAVIYLGATRYDVALADFSTGIRLSPTNGAAYHGRSLAEFRLGRVKEAESDEKAARALGFGGKD